MTMSKESIVRNVEVRRLLAEGKTPGQVADLLKIPVANVYSVRAYDKKKQIAQDKRRVGRPKGSVNKTKPTVSKTTLLELDRSRLKDELFDVKELNEQLVRSLQEATTPKIVYREVPVPQPFSHYTFWQRLRILFLGGAA